MSSPQNLKFLYQSSIVERSSIVLKSRNTVKRLKTPKNIQAFFLLLSPFFLSACMSPPKPLTQNLSLREKLNQLSHKLTEKQNQIENIKTENKILKKLVERENVRQRRQVKSLFQKKKSSKEKKRKRAPATSEETNWISSEENREQKPKSINPLSRESLSQDSVDNNDFQLENPQANQFQFQRKEALTINPPPDLLDDPDAFKFNMPFEETARTKEETILPQNTDKNARFPASQSPMGQIKNSNLYSKALRAYKVADQKRLNQLARFSLKNHPNNFYTDDILFLSGKLDAKKGLYKKAIKKWNQILKKYSSSNKKASALLWTGIAYQKLKLQSPAFASFKRVILEHPQSPEAYLARKKIQSIKSFSSKDSTRE